MDDLVLAIELRSWVRESDRLQCCEHKVVGIVDEVLGCSIVSVVALASEFNSIHTRHAQVGVSLLLLTRGRIGAKPHLPSRLVSCGLDRL